MGPLSRFERHAMSWTDERVELLKKMWGEGQSASQIAKELGGVTRNAVIGKVHRLGLSNRNGGGGSSTAQFLGDLAGRLAFAPHFLQYLDALIVPGHESHSKKAARRPRHATLKNPIRGLF